MLRVRITAPAVAWLAAAAMTAIAQAQPSAEVAAPALYRLPSIDPGPGGSTAYPTGDFHRQLTAATGDAPDSCEYHWGAGGSPFRTGPGRCDTWRVGPRWRTHYDGLVLFRDDADLEALTAAATAGGVALPFADPGTLLSDFEHGAGVRLLVGSQWPNHRGYELQVGYTGVFNWDTQAFNPDAAPPGPVAPGAPITQRSFTYNSSLHSLEVNVMRARDRAWQPFGGVRYLRLDEDLRDLSDQAAPIAFPPVADVTVTDVLRTAEVDNNLIGFHVGARSDLTQLTKRFSINAFGSAGVYCNHVKRESFLNQTDTILSTDDPATPEIDPSTTTATTTSGFKSDGERIAFLGELGVSGSLQINRCLRARFGYQAMLLDGVELGDDLFLGAGGQGDTLLLHGWFAGLERRR